MSDRPDESRPTSEVAGGWFVPKSAMTEQEMTAAAPPEASGTSMPENTTPQQSGQWYVPPGAEARAASLGTDTGSSVPVVPLVPDVPVVPASPAPEQAVKANLPANSQISTEADYSNYVPGVGFVAKSTTPDTTNSAPAEPPVQATGPQSAVPAGQSVTPADQSAVPLVAPGPAPAAPGTPGTSDVQAAGSQNQPGTGAQLAQQAEPVQSTPGTGATPAAAASGTGPAAAVPQRAVSPELMQRYGQVEQSVQVLRRRYAAGTLTRDQLQAELRKLMILDDEGYWWMIGLETDRWYKYNGKDWVPATPPGRAEPLPEAPAAAASAPAASAPAASAPVDQGGTAPNRFDIPLDEYGMPLPQHVPIDDPGATIVGMAAPRLDNTLRSNEPATRPRGSRVADRGVPPYDGGVTMPSGAAQVTQPGASYLGRMSAGGNTVPSAAPVVSSAGPAAAALSAVSSPAVSPRLAPDIQPNYGEKPKGLLADRQRMAGCLIRTAIIGVFLGLLLTLVAVIGGVLGYFSIINRYDAKITALQQSVQAQSQSVRILDSTGRLLTQLNDPNLGARIYEPLDQISPNMIAATVRVENRRFYEDPGFDIIAIVRAVLQNVRAGGIESGASSITQQLTRALVLDPGAAQDRSTTRKISEVIVASEIARRYTKSQIMEFYLNTVNYGNLAYGAQAAAQTYFKIDAKSLNLAQAGFLAGLVQSPATYDPVQNRPAAMARYDDVLTLLANTGCITMEHLPPGQNQICVDASTINPVQVAQVKATTFHPATATALYPHFVNYVEQQLESKFGQDALYTSGFNVYTTVDPKVQDAAQASVTSELARLRGANVNNAAVVAVRPGDGAVLAMIGSADFNNKDINGQFNVALAPRQPGSSIKPFVYAAALENNNGSYWTPATIIWDVSSCFGTTPPYCPTNYDSQFHGPESLRNALGNSFNVPAVKTLQYIGLDRFKDITKRVGITFPLTQPEQAGLASALGATEVSLIDMVQGYSVFANGGKLIDTYAITKVTRKVGDQEQIVFQAKDHPATQVIDPNINYLITNILSDNNARLLEFGANSSLRLRDGRPAAVKTGTTNNFKDNWTIGFTPQLVVGVWVGNSNNTPMRVQSGISGAAPIWNTIMTQALAGQPAQQFAVPSNIGQMNVCADFGTQDFQECKTHGAEIFAQPNVPPPPANVLKTLQVDAFSGLIANEFCPDFVQARTFLIVNDDTAVAWLNNDPKGQQWAQTHNVQLPVVPASSIPTAACDANTPRPRLVVLNPTPNSTVQGLMEIRGTVSIPGFNRYQLEVSPGLNTSNFQIVFGPSQSQPSADNSLLGAWDTNSVPNGQYTMRLWAVDGQGHNASITVPITVNNVTATPIPAQGQPAQPTQQGQPDQGTQPGQTNQSPTFTSPTLTPIVINSNPPDNTNPPTPTMKSIFPPTSTPHP